MAMKHDYGAVYQILDTVTGSRYIGSTTTTRKRWYEHRWALRRGEHKNHALQTAWDRDGECAFSFRTIEMINSSDVLLEREKYWIEKTAERATLYNINMCAAIANTTPRSEQARDNARQATLRYFQSSDGRQVTSASTRQGMQDPALRARLSEKAKNRQGNNLKAIHEVTTPDGETIEVTSLKQYAKEHELSYDCLLRAREPGYSYRGLTVKRVA